MTGSHNNKISKSRRKEGTLKKKFNFGRVDHEVMKRWDNSKTTLENFALMGLQYNNKFVSENQKALNKLGMEATPVNLTVPKEVKSKDRGVNFHFQHYIKALIIKYKDDYEKMKMDHKLNFYQKTATELEKLSKKYIVLYGHPLYGDIYQKQLQEDAEKLAAEKAAAEEAELKLKQQKEAEELKLKQQQQQQQLNKTTTTTTTKKVVSKKPTAAATKETTTPITTTTTKKVVKKVISKK